MRISKRHREGDVKAVLTSFGRFLAVCEIDAQREAVEVDLNVPKFARLGFGAEVCEKATAELEAVGDSEDTPYSDVRRGVPIDAELGGSERKPHDDVTLEPAPRTQVRHPETREPRFDASPGPAEVVDLGAENCGGPASGDRLPVTVVSLSRYTK